MLTIGTVSGDTDHARMRKLMSHAFSEAALREQLPLIASHMLVFISQIQLRSKANEARKVDLNEWLNYLAFDIVADLSFGESLGALTRGTPDPYIERFYGACRTYVVIPMMHEYCLFKMFFFSLMKIPAVRKAQEVSYRGTRAKVERRMASQCDRKDFMNHVSESCGQTHHFMRANSQIRSFDTTMSAG
jgi:cytochrome P450